MTLCATLLAALFVICGSVKTAHAVPAFARKYKTSCTTCHTVFPMLNPFGEAFRRDGFRFPSQGGSLDSDAVKADMLPLGQPSYKKIFPRADWPDSITQSVPLGFMVNGGVHFNFPKSDSKAADGHVFAWNDLIQEFHIFAAGAFNNSLTYFTEITLSEDEGVSIEHAALFWNDIVGPRHLVNLSVGRLWGPTLSSWGIHSSYLSDTEMPGIIIGALYNPTGPDDIPQVAFGHPDGIELNGIAGHRFDYSLGWVASGAADGLAVPNSQDAYAHIGVKFGGMTLDGEGPCGAVVPNPMKPWAETSFTLDAFGYHGLFRVDSGVDPANPTPQDDQINLLGGVARLQVGSLMVTAGGTYEHHSQPYQGAAPVAPATVGVANTDSAKAFTGYGEIDYVVFPWLVPAVRVEYTHIGLDAANGGGSAHLLRIVPGIATSVRPNIRLVLTGDIETAHGVPPAGDWGNAGGTIAPAAATNKTQAEQINADVAWAF